MAPSFRRQVSRHVVVLDMGTANIFSLSSALRFLGVRFEVTADPDRVPAASHLILPGVGAFDPASRQLHAQGLLEPLRHFALMQRRPLLGVCLGMQLLFEGSEEGVYPGTALLPGRLERLTSQHGGPYRVPHVGFAPLTGFEPTGIFAGLQPGSMFYFTHSFARRDSVPDTNAAMCMHTDRFVAAVQRGNICGVQFHPEKSQANGLRLLANFLRLPSEFVS
jgi:imidazole glycerol-phosphate synthase subunit HisH